MDDVLTMAVNITATLDRKLTGGRMAKNFDALSGNAIVALQKAGSACAI
ncbi:MAG: hypothetical protein WCD79_11755 [Chthoniobacteraceae bacterium]